jgi:hypothetical protein
MRRLLQKSCWRKWVGKHTWPLGGPTLTLWFVNHSIILFTNGQQFAQKIEVKGFFKVTLLTKNGF